MANLAKIAQREDQRGINTLRHANGDTTDSGTDTIDLLTQTHFPAATGQKHITYNNRRNAPTEEINRKYQNWINEKLIKEALAGFEKKKSPGPDGLEPIIFEYLPPQFIDALQTVYKSAIHLGYTPRE